MTLLVAWLRALPPGRTRWFLAGSIALVGIVGIATLWLDPGNAWFDLDSEVGLAWPPSDSTVALPALWSALLFAFAGTGWLVVGRTWSADRTGSVALAFGAILVFLGIDELFRIHERLEFRASVDWQVLYLPIAVVAALLLLVIARHLRAQGRRISPMLVGGGACYALAAGLEFLQWRGAEQVEFYVYLMVPEELLELCGSALIALSAIATLRSSAPPVARSATERPG